MGAKAPQWGYGVLEQSESPGRWREARSARGQASTIHRSLKNFGYW